MSFANPQIFFLLLIPFVIFAFLILTNKDGIERVFSKEVLERIKVENSGLSNRTRNILFFIAIFLMIVALSHPYITKSKKKIDLKGLDIVLAIDLSASMRGNDRYPNRIEFAVNKVKEMLQQMPEDEFMLLTFSDGVYLVSPLTDDKDTLSSVLDGIGKNSILNSSNFTALAKVLKRKLKGKDEKIAIIVSDGASKDDLEEFKKIIDEEKITLYAILVGTKSGATLSDKNGKAILDKRGKLVISRVNEYLGKIAKDSGGDYIVADYGASDIKELVRKIEDKFNGKLSGKSIEVEDRVELFYYPLILALLFLFAAFISIPPLENIEFKFNYKRVRDDS